MGVYPALVTPFLSDGSIDFPGVAKLISFHAASGSKGVVLAGTNGEGPSLSAVEKRDLIRHGCALADSMTVIAGLSTQSLPEAIWLCNQAQKSGAAAGLALPPSYFEPNDEGVLNWFSQLCQSTELPLIYYHFPRKSGFNPPQEFFRHLLGIPGILGIKDSSGSMENLAAFKRMTSPDQILMVGNETLLLEALRTGWTGTISGAANVLALWMSRIVADFDTEPTRFQLLLPLIERLRSLPQPATNKSILAEWGVIERRDVRLPLFPVDATEVTAQIESITGIRRGQLGF